ncbi:MAG: 2,3-bisphosphoglycerate-independent phosphoglycerate mutase [Patescibacteria group bacterium]|jgi:2,3-bisphosphoglycerate-independent phosphoglycerate mutase
MGKKYPTVLCVLDGFGIAPKSKANAISLAKMPTYDFLWKKFPHTALQASGKYAGLPTKQAGNSEAGHMNIGAGRVVEQDAVRVSESIADGTFFKNPAFAAAIKHVTRNKSDVHLMGMLSNDQSAHADPNYLNALLELFRLKGCPRVYLHLFTDGRDSPPYLAIKLLQRLRKRFKDGEVMATIMGRFYAMDRKKDWSRTKAAYEAMVLGKGFIVDDPQDAILHAYGKKLTDEFIPPSVVYDKKRPAGTIKDGDAVIFFNLRSDRARQLAKPFVQKDFEVKGGFRREKILNNLYFVALTDFGPDLDSVVTAYPSVDLLGTLPMVVDTRPQLYIAETEKYAHVTYFFNGGYADPVAGEERIRISSVDVSRYDKKPAMSAREITAMVLKSLNKNKHEFITINFANPDMIGHTGNIPATVQCLEVVDKCLEKIYDAIKEKDGNFIITSDHGNCDAMLDLRTGEVLTEHSKNPVPFILGCSKFKKVKIRKGVIGDVAPTILEVMGIKKPVQMKGRSLII